MRDGNTNSGIYGIFGVVFSKCENSKLGGGDLSSFLHTFIAKAKFTLKAINYFRAVWFLRFLQKIQHSLRRDSITISQFTESHFFAKRAAPPPRSPTHLANG